MRKQVLTTLFNYVVILTYGHSILLFRMLGHHTIEELHTIEQLVNFNQHYLLPQNLN